MQQIISLFAKSTHALLYHSIKAARCDQTSLCDLITGIVYIFAFLYHPPWVFSGCSDGWVVMLRLITDKKKRNTVNS